MPSDAITSQFIQILGAVWCYNAVPMIVVSDVKLVQLKWIRSVILSVICMQSCYCGSAHIPIYYEIVLTGLAQLLHLWFIDFIMRNSYGIIVLF